MGLTPELINKLSKKGFTDEQIEYIDKEVYMDFKRHNRYKILSGNKYRIIRKIQNSTNVYYALITRSNEKSFLKEVKFCDCESPNYDSFMIYVKKLEENLYPGDRFTRYRIIIKDYDLIETEETKRMDALREFQKDLDCNKNTISYKELEKMI